MFRGLFLRRGPPGLVASEASYEGKSFVEKDREARLLVETRLLEKLRLAGVKIAADEADEGSLSFPNAAAAVTAACQAAAGSVEELVVTQRRLEVARTANQRLARQVAHLERRAIEGSEAQLEVERQEASHRLELTRLSARNAHLAASLDAMVSIAEGYRAAEATREEEVLLEREAHSLQVSALERSLEEVSRARAALRSRFAEMRIQRPSGSANSSAGRLSPAPPSPTRSEARSEEGAGPRPPSQVFSLAATPLAAPEPPYSDDFSAGDLAGGSLGMSPAGRGQVQRQLARARRELKAETHRRGETEAALAGTQAALQKAEGLAEKLQGKLRAREHPEAVAREATTASARRQLAGSPSPSPMQAAYARGTTLAAGPTNPAPTQAAVPKSTSRARPRISDSAAGAALDTAAVAKGDAPAKTGPSRDAATPAVAAGSIGSQTRVLRSPERRDHQKSAEAGGDAAEAPRRGLDPAIQASAATLNATLAAAADAAAAAGTTNGTTPFMVRGRNYLSDKVKIPAGPPLGNVLRAEYYRSAARVDHIMSVCHGGRASPGQFVVVVVLQIPGAPFVNLATHFGLPVAALPKSLWEECGGADPGEAEILRELGLADGVPAAAGENAAPNGQKAEELEAFRQLFGAFVDGRDDSRDGKFKLIPAVVEAPWIVRHAVGSRPAIVGRKLKNRYFRGPGYLEVDIDIGSSAVAATVLALVRDYTTSLTVEVGFTVEGQEADELPEKLLGAVRFTRIDFREACKDLPGQSMGV